MTHRSHHHPHRSLNSISETILSVCMKLKVRLPPCLFVCRVDTSKLYDTLQHTHIIYRIVGIHVILYVSPTLYSTQPDTA